MWQTPNQRVRAIINARKREREKARFPVHFKRINAQAETKNGDTNQVIKTQIRVLLNDLSPRGLGFFSPVTFYTGEEINILINDPQKITLKCRVLWCQEQATSSHVISKQPYAYKLGVEFLIEKEEEQQAISEFCYEVEKSHLRVTKAA